MRELRQMLREFVNSRFGGCPDLAYDGDVKASIRDFISGFRAAHYLQAKRKLAKLEAKYRAGLKYRW